MKVNAYVLAADPAWVEASVLSYYDIVERIVVSYDETGISFSGTPLDPAEALARLRKIDRKGKMDFRPGRFYEDSLSPMSVETKQRGIAISQASDGVDWILQLDTDEVVLDPASLLRSIELADRAGRLALDFPSIWLYSYIRENRFLCWSSRFRGCKATYPGSMAVKPTVNLQFGRRSFDPPFHVNFRKNGEVNGRPVSSDEILSHQAAIVHLSMVRSLAQLELKFNTWGHSRDRDWSPELECWRVANRHPYLAAILSQFDLSTRRRFLWPISIPKSGMLNLQASPIDIENMQLARQSHMSYSGTLMGVWRGWWCPAAERVGTAVRKRVPLLARER